MMTTGRRLEDHVDVIEIRDAARLYIACPGIACHTTPTHKRDTMLIMEGAPTIVCMHTSCGAAVADKNRELRRAFPSNAARFPSRFSRARVVDYGAFARDLQKQRAAETRKRILQEYTWPLAEIWEASPCRLTNEPNLTETRHFLRLAFDLNDLVWIGQPERSNAPGAIRSTAEWLDDAAVMERSSICPNPFMAVEGGRTKGNAAKARFVVAEADALRDDPEENQNQSGALIRWLREKAGLNLFAVVSSGNKSLHAWFAIDARLEVFLANNKAGELWALLGLDPAGLRPYQAFRLPGHMRHDTGRVQALLYLDPVAGINRDGITTTNHPRLKGESAHE